MSQNTILCYGNDELLVETRQRLLEKVGLPVWIATTPSEFRSKVRSALPVLIVFCHSLSGEECASAASFLREFSPLSKILRMHSGAGGCDLDREYTDFYSYDGPGALLGVVKTLLCGPRIPGNLAGAEGSSPGFRAR